MKLSELLENKVKGVFTVSSDATAQEVLRELNNKKVGALMVVNNEGGVEGLVSERDLLRNLQTCMECKDTKVTEIMTDKDHLVIAHPPDNVEYAMKAFTKNKIRHLPILDGEKLVGIISIGDVIHSMLDEVEFENKVLKDYVAGSYPVLTS